MSGADARAKIDAGADLVQIYTGLIYKGPALVTEAARALARQPLDALRDRSRTPSQVGNTSSGAGMQPAGDSATPLSPVHQRVTRRRRGQRRACIDLRRAHACARRGHRVEPDHSRHAAPPQPAAAHSTLPARAVAEIRSLGQAGRPPASARRRRAAVRPQLGAGAARPARRQTMPGAPWQSCSQRHIGRWPRRGSTIAGQCDAPLVAARPRLPACRAHRAMQPASDQAAVAEQRSAAPAAGIDVAARSHARRRW